MKMYHVPFSVTTNNFRKSFMITNRITIYKSIINLFYHAKTGIYSLYRYNFLHEENPHHNNRYNG